MILSVSRRTDIPRFHLNSFLEVLKKQEVYVRSPYDRKKVQKIPLKREDLEFTVFWTKDGRKLFNKTDELQDLGIKDFYINYTYTPYGREIEPAFSDRREIGENISAFSDRFGKDRIFLRYDPVLKVNRSVEFHTEAFTRLVRRFSGSVDRIIISLVDYYPGIPGKYLNFTDGEMEEILTNFKAAAQSYDVDLYSCCEGIFTSYGITPGACIDKKHIEKLTGRRLLTGKDKNQRRGCLCTEAVDIGSYHSCPGGCVYCYGKTGGPLVQSKKNSKFLIGEKMKGDVFYDRKTPFAFSSQTDLFRCLKKE